MTSVSSRIRRIVTIAAASALLLTGCASVSESEPTPSAASVAGESVTMTDAWVKAADEGMTAGFGALHNSSDSEITVAAVQSTVADAVELHETVESSTGVMTMREVEGGFSIAAGDTLQLEPGANHIMLMGLTDALEAGDAVSFTLVFSDDSTYTFEAPVKDYSGANETYEGSDHGEMDH